MLFGERIKQLRTERQWTQEYVCEKLNISAGALSRYETSMYEPKSLELIRDFANLFGVSTDYLLGKSLFQNTDAKYYAIKQAEIQFDFNDTLNSKVMEQMNTIIRKILKYNVHVSDNPSALYQKIVTISDIPQFNEVIKTILFCMIETQTKPEEVDVNFWYNHPPYGDNNKALSNIEIAEKEPEIRQIERAAKNMTQKDKEKMLNMLKLAFEEAFNEDSETQ